MCRFIRPSPMLYAQFLLKYIVISGRINDIGSAAVIMQKVWKSGNLGINSTLAANCSQQSCGIHIIPDNKEERNERINLWVYGLRYHHGFS